MKFPTFRNAVKNLPAEAKARHDALWKIYEDVREQAVYDLAQAVRKHDRATRTHGMIITIEKQHRKL